MTAAVPGSLWGITSYFNPMRYRRRLDNYRIFRRALGIPLLAVELSYDGVFDLYGDDADILVRRRGRDVMWQKERLLNVALRSLPVECREVAWLDCDILLPDGWEEAAAGLLQKVPLLQLFRNVHYLGSRWTPDVPPATAVERHRPSIAAGVSDGLPALDCLRHPGAGQRPGTYANGLAWAARRDLLAAHGLYDASIIGGGDRALAAGALGAFGHTVEWHALNAQQTEDYLAWAEPFYRDCRGQVGVLAGDLYHLWHGSVASRGLGSRQAGLAEYAFNPKSDIAVDDSGCWRWNSAKPGLHDYVRDYFASRREDG